MFRLHLEWDYGQDNIVFTSEEKAMKWVDDLKMGDIDENFDTYQTLAAEGLCSIQKLEVI